MMIVMAGMIGSGKTTYTRYLAEEFGSEPFYESVDDNPILERFYEDKAKWGFALQVHFLNTRFRSIKKALVDDNNILDRSIYEDQLFTLINYEAGNIRKEEMDIYNSLLENMLEEIEGMPKKAPDLLIYLYGSFDKIMQQIRSRGRDYEQTPNQVEYFRMLNDKYQAWYDSYNHSAKISINIDQVSIENPSDRKIIFKMIKDALAEARK